jgi:hypothetical protein
VTRDDIIEAIHEIGEGLEASDAYCEGYRDALKDVLEMIEEEDDGD